MGFGNRVPPKIQGKNHYTHLFDAFISRVSLNESIRIVGYNLIYTGAITRDVTRETSPETRSDSGDFRIGRPARKFVF